MGRLPLEVFRSFTMLSVDEITMLVEQVRAGKLTSKEAASAAKVSQTAMSRCVRGALEPARLGIRGRMEVLTTEGESLLHCWILARQLLAATPTRLEVTLTATRIRDRHRATTLQSTSQAKLVSDSWVRALTWGFYSF